MKKIVLPSPEETQIEVESNGKVQVLEVLDLHDLQADCTKELERLGLDLSSKDNQVEWFKLYITKAKEEFDIHLNMTSVVPFLTEVNKEADILKKKYSELLGLSDTSESISDSSSEIPTESPTENSV